MSKEYKVKINGNEYNISINDADGDVAGVEVNGMPYSVELLGELTKKRPKAKPVTIPTNSPVTTVSKPVAPVSSPAPSASGAGSAVKSPLPGVIIDINVKVGDEIKSGQKILVLEAMKMENNINADRDGKVIEIKVGKGDSVLEGADLVIIG